TVQALHDELVEPRCVALQPVPHRDIEGRVDMVAIAFNAAQDAGRGNVRGGGMLEETAPELLIVLTRGIDSVHPDCIYETRFDSAWANEAHTDPVLTQVKT